MWRNAYVWVGVALIAGVGCGWAFTGALFGPRAAFFLGALGTALLWFEALRRPMTMREIGWGALSNVTIVSAFGLHQRLEIGVIATVAVLAWLLPKRPAVGWRLGVPIALPLIAGVASVLRVFASKGFGF